MTEIEYLKASEEDAPIFTKIWKETEKLQLVGSRMGLVTLLLQQIIEEKKGGEESMEDFIHRMTADMESIWLTGEAR